MSSSISMCSCSENSEPFSISKFGTSIRYESSNNEIFIENLKNSTRKNEKKLLSQITKLELNINSCTDKKVVNQFLSLFSPSRRLESTLRIQLSLWIDESRGTEEYEGRVEASKRIYSCHKLQRRELDLSGLNLSCLPACLFELHHISNLELSNNRLTTIAEGISNIRNLEKINLTSNFLKSIPDTEIKNLIDRRHPNKLQIILTDNYLETLPSFYSSYSKQDQENYFSESLKYTPDEKNLAHPACIRLDHFLSPAMETIREKFVENAINDLKNKKPFHPKAIWSVDKFITSFSNEVSKNNYSLQDLLSYIPISLREDKNLILKLIQSNPLFYIYLPESQKNDFSIVTEALCKANAKKELQAIFEHTPHSIWSNSDFANFLEKTNIQTYLPNKYYEEKTIFLTYLPVIDANTLMISKKFKEDPEVLLNVLKYYPFEKTNLKNDEALWAKLKDSYDFEKFSSWNPMFAAFCPKSWLPNNENDAYRAVEINPFIFPFLNPTLQQHPDINEMAVLKINSNLLKSNITKFFSNPRSIANSIFNQTVQKINHKPQINYLRAHSMLKVFLGVCSKTYHPHAIFKEIIKISKLNLEKQAPLNVSTILNHSLCINKNPHELEESIKKGTPLIIPFNISTEGEIKNSLLLINDTHIILTNYDHKSVSNQIKIYEYSKNHLSANVIELIISISNQHLTEAPDLHYYVSFFFSTLIPIVLGCQEIFINDLSNFKKLKSSIPQEAEVIHSLFSLLHINNSLKNEYYDMSLSYPQPANSSFTELYKNCLNFYYSELEKLSNIPEIPRAIIEDSLPDLQKCSSLIKRITP